MKPQLELMQQVLFETDAVATELSHLFRFAIIKPIFCFIEHNKSRSDRQRS